MIDVGVRVGAIATMALLACAGAPVALAALPNPLADGLRHCAGESDQAKRLACFDALAAGLEKVEADQFGLTADIAHKRQPQGKSQPAAGAADMGAAATSRTAASSATAPAAIGGSGSATTPAGTAGPASMTSATPSNRAEPKAGVLPGKITALRQGSGGMLVFTLDNNQQWAQADADSRFSFKVGDDVRIEHGAMGSFWLAASKGRKTKVKRIS